METQYFKRNSPNLGHGMEMKIWGTTGQPVIFIPTEEGRFYDFENFGMAETCAPWIDAGEMMACAIDPIDDIAFCSHDNPHRRMILHERWVTYIMDEVAPFLAEKVRAQTGTQEKVEFLVFGCGLGGTHAANLYLRYPFLFNGLLSLSGTFDAARYFKTYSDELVYLNSPVVYLPNMVEDHPYMKAYRHRRAVICCGQGEGEQPNTVSRMRDICAEKGIPIWVDLWGEDVTHEWSWWCKEAEYFLPYLLGDEDWPLELGK